MPPPASFGGSPTSTSMPPWVLVTYLALGAAFIASFLPWARVWIITVNGTDGDGVLTALLSVAALVCFALAKPGREDKRGLMVAGLILAILCAAVYVYDFINVSRLAGDVDDDGILDVNISPQIGLILGAIGSVASVVTQIIGLRNRSAAASGPTAAGYQGF